MASLFDHSGIALCGPQGSGKSTTATALFDAISRTRETRLLDLGVSLLVMGFATGLRRELAGIIADLNDDGSAHTPFLRLEARARVLRALYAKGSGPDAIAARHLLKAYGAYRRSEQSNWWINVFDKARESEGPIFTIVDDLRYDNERAYLEDNNFKIFRLAPDPSVPPITDSHESEQDWPNWEVDAEIPWAPVEDRVKRILSRMDMGSVALPTGSVAYLASAHSHPDAHVREMNLQIAKNALLYLWQQGVYAFSPIVHSHELGAELARSIQSVNTFEYWQKFDERMIDSADCMIVLTSYNWRESRGIASEIAYCEKIGKPVFYLSVPEYQLTHQPVERQWR